MLRPYGDVDTPYVGADTPYAGGDTSYRGTKTSHAGAHVGAKHRLKQCLATHEVNPALLRPYDGVNPSYGDVDTPYAEAHPLHGGVASTTPPPAGTSVLAPAHPA